MAIIGTKIDEAVRLLTGGKLVAIPTETVYGLAANALDEQAVLNIFQAKERPSFDPLIIHTHHLAEIEKYVSHIPDKARVLAAHFWPGPLTMLLNKKPIIPDAVTSGLDTVAVRIPNHPLSLSLLERLDFPLAAPSANPFGYVSPTQASHVDAQLGAKIPYILDGGPCAVGLESTIIGFDEEERATIFRLGGMKLEDLQSTIGEVHITLNKSSNPQAPGMLKSHYAPQRKLLLGNIAALCKAHQHLRVGVISFSKDYSYLNPAKHIILSEKAHLDEAATNLFRSLRAMDETDVDLILAEKMPEIGLGPAINDRLERASVRY